MPRADRILALALASSALALAIGANGCSSGPAEEVAASSSQALTGNACLTAPFVAPESTNCETSGGGSGGGGSSSGGGKPYLQIHTESHACTCDRVLGTPQVPKGAARVACADTNGDLQIIPPPPDSKIAGCTKGVVVAGMDGLLLYGNTWACPAGSPIPDNLGAAPTCLDADAGTGSIFPDGSSTCERIIPGTTIESDCMGNVLDPSSWILLQERVFQTPDPHHCVGSACGSACAIPG